MLEMSNVIKKFGKYTALNKLNLNIGDGELYGIVGPNGAGKTTAIKIMTGLACADSGYVKIGGKDISTSFDGIKGMIGYVPDYFGVYDNLNVREYMEFFAAGYGIHGIRAGQRCFELLSQVGLEDMADFMVDSLSRGMQQRLCLARALIHNPEFIIMDEPTSGMDPKTRLEFRELIRELNSGGRTICISSHQLSELAELCTDIGIIDRGRLVVSGKVRDILDRVERSNPIMINILDGVSSAMAVFKRNPNVRSIAANGKSFMLNFDGGREDEAVLLQQLIDMDIPVHTFVREPGSLESFFLQITDHQEERLVLRNDY